MACGVWFAVVFCIVFGIVFCAAFRVGVGAARAATITDYGRAYSGYYFNDPTGYREVFTEQVTFHLYHNYPSCSTNPRPCADNEFYVTVTPTADIVGAYAVSIDDPPIVDSELYNGQEGGPSFIFLHNGGSPLAPTGNGAAIQFRGTATTSAWAILNSQTSLQATSTYHLAAGTSYDVIGWWYDGKPSNLTDGQTITIGIWAPDPIAIPYVVTSSLAQYEADGVTAVVQRSLAAGDTVVFSATLASAGMKPIQLQVEVEPVAVSFTGAPTATSTFVAPGTAATATASGLAPDGYHWQARAVDEDGNASQWITLSNPPADMDFAIGSGARVLYRTDDQSASIGTDNGQAGTGFGPLTVRVKLGRPLGGTMATTTLSLALYQEGTSYCGIPGYTLQGYSDDAYRNVDGPAYEFGGWVDASGTLITSRDVTGPIVGVATGRINPYDYYLLSFGSCDFSRPIAIAAAPGATYTCTQRGGPFDNYCYAADVVGEPFTTLRDEGPREPVVIIPGIAGSVLARASDEKEVWPNVNEMASLEGLFSRDAYLDDLALDASGRSTVAMTAPDILRVATATISFLAVQKDFYNDLINAFTAEGYVENRDLFVAPYDWRLGVAAEENALDAKIQQAIAASPHGKINIVAHSMGGVLVKQYLADHADHSFLDKLVLVGVPQLGAPKAFKVLDYGDNLGLALGPFDILSSAEIKKISQNMPSLYELLPSPRYVQVDGGYVRDFRNSSNGTLLSYDETKNLMTSDPSDSRNAALMDAARAFHAGLDGQPVGASNIYNIVGCREPTISEFDLYDDGVVDINQTTGDGTVPEVSAMNLTNSFHNYFVDGGATGINHDGLVTDARPLSLITTLIDNGTVVDGDLPWGVSSVLADCFSGWHAASSTTGAGSENGSSESGSSGAMIEFSAHGTVTLEISDPTGLHTGITYDGSVELGIPGSSYDEIGDNTFVTVPENENAFINASSATSTSASASTTPSTSASTICL